MTTALSQLGTHPLDILGDASEVATFGSYSSNTIVRLFDTNTYNNSYYIGKSNSILYITKDTGNVNVGIGTTLPIASASLQVQGTMLASNIGTYDTSSNIYFNGQNIAGISNISFTGNIYQGGQPFKTSQWTTDTSTNNVFINKNVTIGSNMDVTGNTSNLVVVGDVLITGQVKAGSVSATYSTDSTGSFVPLTIYNIDTVTNYKNILTNDTNIVNRVLYSTSLTPGRYLLNGNVVFKNMNKLSIFDPGYWAQLELYKLSPSALAAANPKPSPLRIMPITPISDGDIQNAPFNWLMDLSGVYNTNITIVVNGRGHYLQFLGNNDTSTGSYMATMPIRGLGYDQNLAVNQALQVNPIRSTTVVSGAPTKNFALPGIDGYFTLDASQVDVFVNGVKKYYYGAGNIANDFSVTTNTYSSDLKSYFTVVLTNNANINDKVDIIAWPRATASSYYTSGYLYQTINTNTAPWQLVNDGGVRIGDKVVIDGDLYVQGSIWGGCNTTNFFSGLTGTGTPPINSYSNIIGTTNLIDGCVTSTKLNLVTGNVGIGTATASQPLHVYGQALFSSNVFITGKAGHQDCMIVNLTTESGAVTTGNNVYSFRAPFAMNLYQTPRILLTSASSSGSVVVNVRTGTGSAAAASTVLTSGITITQGSYSSGSSSALNVAIADDAVITFDVQSAGTGATGLKAVLYYQVTF